VSSSKQSRQIARLAVERPWSRDYINKILYTYTYYRYLSSYRGTAKSVARVDGIYLLSNDQTTGVEKIINNSWTLQRRGICARAYNTSKKEKSLCAHNTVLLQLCVCEMVLKCKLPRRNRRIAVNEYMCLHDGIISLSLSLSQSLPRLYPLRMHSIVYNNNIIIIIIIIRHESIVPMLYIRGKDNCREYGGPTAASVTRLVAAADHRYIYI